MDKLGSFERALIGRSELSYLRLMRGQDKHAGASYSEIGRYFGGRNHSTVMSAEKKVLGWLKDDARNPLLPGFDNAADIIADLESSLGA